MEQDKNKMMLSATVAVQVQKVSDDLLIKIKNDESFVNALQILKDEQVTVNLTSPKLYKEDKNTYTVVFEIIDPKNSCDYKEIICTSKNDELFTYFEEVNNKFEYEVESKGSYWTSWQDMPGTAECRHNGWCWSNNKQALYHWQFRKKIKNGNIVKWEYRIVKDHCGCP
jgi:hypothetical protein